MTFLFLSDIVRFPPRCFRHFTITPSRVIPARRSGPVGCGDPCEAVRSGRVRWSSARRSGPVGCADPLRGGRVRAGALILCEAVGCGDRIQRNTAKLFFRSNKSQKYQQPTNENSYSLYLLPVIYNNYNLNNEKIKIYSWQFIYTWYNNNQFRDIWTIK